MHSRWRELAKFWPIETVRNRMPDEYAVLIRVAFADAASRWPTSTGDDHEGVVPH
ncbi:MAG: hypothetical protein R3A46_07820 [Thermomicrobiales bacterium]